jgi:hypothetical protein
MQRNLPYPRHRIPESVENQIQWTGYTESSTDWISFKVITF